MLLEVGDSQTFTARSHRLLEAERMRSSFLQRLEARVPVSLHGFGPTKVVSSRFQWQGCVYIYIKGNLSENIWSHRSEQCPIHVCLSARVGFLTSLRWNVFTQAASLSRCLPWKKTNLWNAVYSFAWLFQQPRLSRHRSLHDLAWPSFHHFHLGLLMMRVIYQKTWELT